MPLGADWQGYPLARWVRWQWAAYASGRLDGQRGAVGGLGMVWDPAEADWQDNLAAARLYMGRYGTLAAPRTTVVAEPGGQAELTAANDPPGTRYNGRRARLSRGCRAPCRAGGTGIPRSPASSAHDGLPAP
ncbi:hypothetical protein ACIRNI_22680 [Streptomyces sp. NPDC093546]|uniref:hypothetical protein n=1 Tax=Streptomyces sp. NPDC093546 TaxID=3366040 RepID=UPI0038303A8D